MSVATAYTSVMLTILVRMEEAAIWMVIATTVHVLQIGREWTALVSHIEDWGVFMVKTIILIWGVTGWIPHLSGQQPSYVSNYELLVVSLVHILTRLGLALTTPMCILERNPWHMFIHACRYICLTNGRFTYSYSTKQDTVNHPEEHLKPRAMPTGDDRKHRTAEQ